MARLRYNGLATGSAGALVGLALGASLTSGGTSVTFNAALTHSNGTAVPTITGSDFIPLEILDTNGRLSEIVYLTAYTAGATTGTISRGQEGTTGVAHSSGDKIVGGATTVDISPWTKYLDNALTSASGFTGLSGTWSAGSGQIAQTGTAAQYNRIKYDTPVMRSLGASQVEVRYDSGGTGATRACGLMVGFDGTDNAVGNLNVYLFSTDTGSTWKVRAEANGIGVLLDSTVSYTPGTYATLSVVHTTVGYEIYYNGTYLGLVHNTNTANRVAQASYIGLVTYASTATFRNLKTWGITPPF